MNKIGFKNKLSFWLYQARTGLFAIFITVAVGIFLVVLNTRVGSEKVVGVAHAYSYVASYFGNKAKLTVMLSGGNLAHISIASPSQVKIGESVCLIKSKNLLGAAIYGFSHVGKCT